MNLGGHHVAYRLIHHTMSLHHVLTGKFSGYNQDGKMAGAGGSARMSPVQM